MIQVRRTVAVSLTTTDVGPWIITGKPENILTFREIKHGIKYIILFLQDKQAKFAYIKNFGV